MVSEVLFWILALIGLGTVGFYGYGYVKSWIKTWVKDTHGELITEVMQDRLENIRAELLLNLHLDHIENVDDKAIASIEKWIESNFREMKSRKYRAQ